MPEMEYKPWKKVIVHELVIETLENFLRVVRLSTPMGGISKPLRWCKGWVMLIEGMDHTPEVMIEQLDGRIHWVFVMMSRYPEYAPVIDIQEGAIKIPLLDHSHYPTTKNFMNWFLKEFEEEIKASAER